ncbi:MAG: MarR family transcriptional regulator [Bdellovibrionota bacterium]
MDTEVAQLVKMSLVFHNLNKEAEARFGLSLVQYHLLVTLRDMPGCSQQKLADAAGMHPSTLTQSLKRLQRKRAVFVGEDPKDSRKKILSMTRSGRELLSKLSRGFGELLLL